MARADLVSWSAKYHIGVVNSFYYSKKFDSKIEYISNTSKKPTLKWNIFVIVLRIILASNKAFINFVKILALTEKKSFFQNLFLNILKRIIYIIL